MSISIPPRRGEHDQESDDIKLLLVACASCDKQQLADLLKWPFCIGEAQKIVLTELEKKTGRKFGGNVWKFIDQGAELRIKNLDEPTQRPTVEAAREELTGMIGSLLLATPSGI